MKKHVSLGHVHFSYLVPKVGIEPTRYRYRWILSPVRLPISPLGQCVNYILFLNKITIDGFLFSLILLSYLLASRKIGPHQYVSFGDNTYINEIVQYHLR